MAHHGIAVDSDGRVFTFDAHEPRVHVRNSAGEHLTSWQAPIATGHGLRIVGAPGMESLWVAHNADSWVRLPDGNYGSAAGADRVEGCVVQFTLDGEEIRRLEAPEHGAYQIGSYCPTDVAVDDQAHGGSGDIWVADGYGQSLVHWFSSTGKLKGTLSGDEGAGRFSGPHGIFVRCRGGVCEVYVADRGNSRIQVYDANGRFLRIVGSGAFISPSGMARLGDGMVVAELDGRLAILDGQDEVIGFLGSGSRADRQRPGWPNAIDERGSTVRPQLGEGSFNTPHGVATDAVGNIYVSEWVIGGRLVKLAAGDDNG